MNRWHYRINYTDDRERTQQHFTNAARLETAISETQALPGYRSLWSWVNYAEGESGYFDPMSLPAMKSID